MDPSKASDDRELVDRFLRGRGETEFTAIYRRHTPAMYMLALRLVGGSRQDAEDVVQNAWLNAAAALGRFEWRSSLRTWLSGVVVNCARDLIRGRPRNLDSKNDPDQLASPGRTPDVEIDLERALQALPDGYREVVILFDIEGFSHQHIADLLNIEESASKVRLHRGRKALRRILADRVGSITEVET